MAIFNRYVKLPEGIYIYSWSENEWNDDRQPRNFRNFPNSSARAMLQELPFFKILPTKAIRWNLTMAGFPNIFPLPSGNLT